MGQEVLPISASSAHVTHQATTGTLQFPEVAECFLILPSLASIGPLLSSPVRKASILKLQFKCLTGWSSRTPSSSPFPLCLEQDPLLSLISLNHFPYLLIIFLYLLAECQSLPLTVKLS